MMIIAQRELRNQNAKVIEAVTAGETFVVTRNGEPVAALRPFGLAAALSSLARRWKGWRQPACASIGMGFEPTSTG